MYKERHSQHWVVRITRFQYYCITGKSKSYKVPNSGSKTVGTSDRRDPKHIPEEAVVAKKQRRRGLGWWCMQGLLRRGRRALHHTNVVSRAGTNASARPPLVIGLNDH